MAIYNYINSFVGLPIKEYIAEQGIINANVAIRVSCDDDQWDNEALFLDKLSKLIADPKFSQISALIMGCWPGEFGVSPQKYLDLLVANADKLKNIKALFIGDMTSEDNEISWIFQGDYTSLWSAFPNLQHLQIRGAEGLTLGVVPQNQLTHLIIESGGLCENVLKEIAQGLWTELQHLELWLGCSDYGWDGNIDSVIPLLSTELLPKLSSLALKNSEIQPQILAALIESDILPQLTDIDMSMGILSDKDVELILQHKDKFQGKKLDLWENYISDPMVVKLQVCLEVIADDQRYDELTEDELDDEDCRYVSVSE